jgi:hypothetical protein
MRRQWRIAADADAAACGGAEADGDPRGRRVLLRRCGLVGVVGGGDAEAADGAGVVHPEPGDDAEGVIEVGAGELPRLGGEGQVVLADGADGGGLSNLDRGQRGDGGGRGGRLPSAVRAGAVADLLEVVAVGEAAKVGAHHVGVHDKVEVVVGVVRERGGGGVGEEKRWGRRRRRWWWRRGARVLLDEVAMAERAEEPGRGGRGRLGQRHRGLALVAVELRGREREQERLRRRPGGRGGRGRGHGRHRPPRRVLAWGAPPSGPVLLRVVALASSALSSALVGGTWGWDLLREQEHSTSPQPQSHRPFRPGGAGPPVACGLRPAACGCFARRRRVSA